MLEVVAAVSFQCFRASATVAKGYLASPTSGSQWGLNSLRRRIYRSALISCNQCCPACCQVIMHGLRA